MNGLLAEILTQLATLLAIGIGMWKFIGVPKDELMAEIRKRTDHLDNKLDAGLANLKEKIEGVETKLDGKIDGVETKLDGKIDGLRDELVQTRLQIDGKIDRARDELRADIRDLGRRIDEQARQRYDANKRLARLEAAAPTMVREREIQPPPPDEPTGE